MCALHAPLAAVQAGFERCDLLLCGIKFPVLVFDLVLQAAAHTTAAAQTQPAQQPQSSTQQVVAAAQAAAEATYLANSKASPPSPAFPGLFIPLL